MIKRQKVAAYEYGNILHEEFELHPRPHFGLPNGVGLRAGGRG